MNEQELNKKLAAWAGLKDIRLFVDHSGKASAIQVEMPNCSQLYEIIKPPFTQSLDACFKWLVPKLTDLHITECFDSPIIAEVKRDNISCIASSGTPALALCLAIEKLIDKEKGE